MPGLIIEVIQSGGKIKAKSHYLKQGETAGMRLPTQQILELRGTEHGYKIVKPEALKEDRSAMVEDLAFHIDYNEAPIIARRRALWVVPCEDLPFNPRIVKDMESLAVDEVVRHQFDHCFEYRYDMDELAQGKSNR